MEHYLNSGQSEGISSRNKNAGPHTKKPRKCYGAFWGSRFLMSVNYSINIFMDFASTYIKVESIMETASLFAVFYGQSIKERKGLQRFQIN